MFRFGYSDFRPMVDLQSPDRMSDIRMGDLAIPRAYALPTAQHGEGELDDLGAQAQLIFARYRTGKEFATLYALTRFKKLCNRLEPERNAWKPPAPGKGSEGSLTYRCYANNAVRTGYVYAKTLPGAGLWQVDSLTSFIAPPDRVAAIEAALTRAATSYALAPAWIEHEKQLDAEGLQYQIARQRRRMEALGQQVAQFESRMRAMQSQVNAIERGQEAHQAQFQQFDNAIAGLTPTVDPLSGAERDVWTGPNNGYWVNGSGTLVNSSASPGTDFHQLRTP
jgi:hypothetical protein